MKILTALTQLSIFSTDTINSQSKLLLIYPSETEESYRRYQDKRKEKNPTFDSIPLFSLIFSSRKTRKISLKPTFSWLDSPRKRSCSSTVVETCGFFFEVPP